MTESCGVVAERRRPKRRRRAVVRGRIPGRGRSARALPPRRAPALRAAAVPHTRAAPTTGTAPPILTPPGTTTGGSFSRYCCENCFQMVFPKYAVRRNRSRIVPFGKTRRFSQYLRSLMRIYKVGKTPYCARARRSHPARDSFDTLFGRRPSFTQYLSGPKTYFTR